tara:strand:- start:1915 stop:2748 length:834 start_codon:yes stop_codon:yes gene_type:complete
MSDPSLTDDEGCVDDLMYLLETPNVPADYSMPSLREELPKKASLLNFSLNENGEVNYRDSTVLGSHTGIRLPDSMLDATYICLSLYLDHEVPLTVASTVDAPVFVENSLVGRHREISDKYETANKNQVWLLASDISSSGIVYFLKRKWKLSQGFRKVSGSQWPKFVVVATAHRFSSVCGKVVPSESVVSTKFEVRSKEQSNKSRAARGESEPVRRRRTQETEARAQKLREIQALIIEMRASIAAEECKTKDYKNKLNFVKAITNSSESSKHIYELVK